MLWLSRTQYRLGQRGRQQWPTVYTHLLLLLVVCDALSRRLIDLLVAAEEVGDKDDLDEHLLLDEAEAHRDDGHADDHVKGGA